MAKMFCTFILFSMLSYWNKPKMNAEDGWKTPSVTMTYEMDKWCSTAENRGGSIESMIQVVRKTDDADSTQVLKMARSFGKRLCEMVRNYKHLYDRSFKGQ